MEQPETVRNARNLQISFLWPRQLESHSSWVADGGGKNWASKWHESELKGLVLCHANSPAFFQPAVRTDASLESAELLGDGEIPNCLWVYKVGFS